MDDIIFSAMMVTARVAGAATLAALFLGVAAAHFVTLAGPRRRIIFDTLFTVPMVLPPTVVGFALLWLLSRHGILSGWLGGSAPSVVFTWYGAALASTIAAFPLVYRSARSAFGRIDRGLLEAARTLGLNGLQVFTRVSLPLAAKGIMAGMLLGFARSVGEFGATLIIGGNIPGRTQTLSIAIYEAVNSGRDFDAALAVLATSVFAIALILLVELLTVERSAAV